MRVVEEDEEEGFIIFLLRSTLPRNKRRLALTRSLCAGESHLFSNGTQNDETRKDENNKNRDFIVKLEEESDGLAP